MAYSLLFRWFVGLGMDDAVRNHAVFSKNSNRLLTSAGAQQFFAAVVERAKGFMSDEHFTVDGTPIQAWASHKSFRRKDGPDDDGTNFHGAKRSIDTHNRPPIQRLFRYSDCVPMARRGRMSLAHGRGEFSVSLIVLLSSVWGR